MYYLQSRYYDPEIGRFINADAFVSTGQGILGNNMFTYCGNNPINFADRYGTRREYVRDFDGISVIPSETDQQNEDSTSDPLVETTRQELLCNKKRRYLRNANNRLGFAYSRVFTGRDFGIALL